MWKDVVEEVMVGLEALFVYSTEKTQKICDKH